MQQGRPGAARHVIGTAGHIDHGKTSLVRALTGIDTDRLREEKERGITIELGFAHLQLPRAGAVGVVDVPGHERFVRTMVAGAVGIDLVVLVVAADEGVMPQTREHLDICALLGVRRGLVALSKSDLAGGDLLELCAMDVREALRGTFLEGAPLVPCSAQTGEGLPALLAAIDELLMTAPGRDPEGLLRLPVDRVFSLKGFGTVATGTLWGGRLRPGDELVALPGGPHGAAAAPVKVRGLHIHGQPAQEAVAGQRTAVNLPLPREALERGETLVRPGTLLSSELFDVRVQLLPAAAAPLRRRARVLLHAGTTQRLAQVTLLDRGELQPGEAALAQVQVPRGAGLALLPGDRFILRGFAPQKNHGTTLGGGLVLRTRSARQRRGGAALGQALLAVEGALGELGGKDDAAAAQVLAEREVERAGVLGATLEDILTRLPLPRRRLEPALQRLASAGRPGATPAQPAIVPLPGAGGVAFASRAALELVEAAVLALVRAHHEREPLSPGLPREALHSQLPPLGGDAGRHRDSDAPSVGEGRAQPPSPRLAQKAIERLAAERRLVLERDLARLPTHDPAQAAAAQGAAALAGRMEALYAAAGLGPPRPEEAAQQLGVTALQAKAALDLLLREGKVLRVKDLVFHRAALDELRGRLVAYLKERREISPAEWKDLVGQSRKYTIPLAEHFDAEKVTLRVGDQRRLRG